MDARRLDALARLLGAKHSRRQVLRVAVGGPAAGLVATLAVSEADARRRGRRRRGHGKKRSVDQDACPDDGEPCGDVCCDAGTYCCDPLCGVCAPVGGGCGPGCLEL